MASPGLIFGALALLLAACAQVVTNGPGPDVIPDGFLEPVEEDLSQPIVADLTLPPDLSPTCIAADCDSGHEGCFQGDCLCDAGYVRDQNPSLSSSGRGLCQVDPAVHTQSDVCAKYTQSAVVPANFFSKTSATCDPGTVTAAGLASGLARANYYRWLDGLPDFTTQVTENLSAQRCALVTACNPADGATAHNPPTSSTCYTADGATSAGVSNVAWNPSNLVTAIDLWIADTSNAANLGNRREMMRRALTPIGLGVYVGGTLGSAACLQRKTLQGTAPTPDFLAHPPPGYSPLPVANHVWSFAWPGLATRTPIAATVVRQSDGMTMPVTTALLTANTRWEDAIGITRTGWSPAAGQTYRVTVTAATLKWTYDIKPVTCP